MHKNWHLILGATLVPIGLMVIGTYASLYISNPGWPDFPMLLVFPISMSIGVYSIAMLLVSTKRKTAFFLALYTLFLSIGLFVTSFITSCANGDCI